MERPRVLVERRGAVAHVLLDRPEKRNGLDRAMFEAIAEAGATLKEDRSVRAVVLSGAGKAFCAGLDFASFMMDPSGQQVLLGRTPGSPTNLAQQVAWTWVELDVPVIAALHGHTLGGGLQIALAADVRLAAPDTRMSVMEMRYGLIPDMTITATLLRMVRPDVARELVYTARMVEAEEAVALGLATRICDDPLAEAFALAEQIAARSPHAIRAAKQLLREAPDLDTAAGFARETELQLPLLGSKNQLEAVMASMQKRAPVFDDP